MHSPSITNCQKISKFSKHLNFLSVHKGLSAAAMGLLRIAEGPRRDVSVRKLEGDMRPWSQIARRARMEARVGIGRLLQLNRTLRTRFTSERIRPFYRGFQALSVVR